MIKKLLTIFIISMCGTILLPIIIYQKLTLLHFINYSFYIGGLLLFISFLTITVKGGFFDGITYGFRRMFISKGKELSKEEAHEIPPVSKLVSFDHSPLLYNGLFMILIMLIALFFYY